MESGTMNETRKLVTRICHQRKDLPSIEDKKKGKYPEINDKTKDKVEDWCKNIRSLNTDMGKQMHFLDNISVGLDQGRGGGSNVHSNYQHVIVKRLQKDIEDLVKTCQKTMVLDNQKLPEGGKATDDQWQIKRKDIRTQLNQVDMMMSQSGGSDNNEVFVLISKLLNMRDILQKQIFFSCLYRKLLMWNDLNIHPGEYCNDKVVDCTKILNDFMEKSTHIPTKIQFKFVNLESTGYFSGGNDGKKCESTDTLDALVENFNDMEELIKKNFLLVQKTPDKVQEFNDNNPVQRTLRDQVEEKSLELTRLTEQNRELIATKYKNKDNESNKEINHAAKAEEYKQKLQLKEMENEDSLKIIDNMKIEKAQMKRQQKETDDKVSKYEKDYLPKLKETRKFQKEMFMELERIRNDAELLPWMFRAEAVERKQFKQQSKDAVNEMNTYKKVHDKLTNERNDLKNELKRKERMALLATAARTNLKDSLDQEKQINSQQLQTIHQMDNSIQEAAKEVERYKQKHDEMFNSQSSLNARIEELEQHKLHILEKLKEYGDKGDLSYIVKTQKLGEIQAKNQQNKNQNSGTIQGSSRREIREIAQGEDQEATLIKDGGLSK